MQSVNNLRNRHRVRWDDPHLDGSLSSEELMQYLGKQLKTAVLVLAEILGYHFTLTYNGARFKPVSTDEKKG